MKKQELIKNLEPILSNKEIEVVIKRLNNIHISQTESNYLSRSIRPKLKSAEFASSTQLLSLLDYRRKKYERENKLLKKKILLSLKYIINNIKSIIIYGSYIRNNHSNYRDIDIMIVLNNKLWKTSAEKNILEKNIEKSINIKTDIQLILYDELIKNLPYSPLLQTELEDNKIIYGKINLNKDIIINKPYLYKKLLEIENIIEIGLSIKTKYLYNAIRTCLSIDLFLNNTASNGVIIKTIENNIGISTANALIEDKANSLQKDIALRYLKYLYEKLIIILK